MANGMKVEVRGIRDLSRELSKLPDDLDKELKAAFLVIASKVASEAASDVPTVTGKAAASIKPRASARGASIAFGGTKAPYFPWLDFGGRVGRGKKSVRPFIKEGRFIYPTIRREGDHIREAADEALQRVIKAAGFDQQGSN